ncbi:MAG TPA: SHOCT domain-containing protein [Gaiellaceae bacterium]|nr:SHOCT domain-containing protein [Gaiellaceae bacterium]
MTDSQTPPEETAAPAAPPPPPAPAPPAVPARPPKLSRSRRITVWTLVILASLLALITVLTVWVDRQMLDNNQWKKSSAELINDPAIRSALSIYLVDQLYSNIDVEQQLKNQLPKNLKGIAGPVSAALREPATNGVDFLLARPRVQQTFVNASAVAHQKLVNVLENKTGYGISTGNGVVTVNLSQLVKELGAELGLPSAALDKLPANAGVITVMKSSQLSAAQTGVRILKAASAWAIVLVLVLYGLAIYLARGRRRETLRNIGWAFVVIGLLVLIVRRTGGSYVIDGLVKPANRPAAHHLWAIESSILGQTGRALILYGLVAMLGATLAGPTRVAVAVRRWMAPMLERRPGVCWSVLGAIYLLVILWAPTHALGTWWGILLFGALIALGFEALRRQTVREFPDAAFAGAGMTASVRALGSRAAGAGHRRSGGSTAADQIARLAELHDAGALTDEEFAQAKATALQA